MDVCDWTAKKNSIGLKKQNFEEEIQRKSKCFFLLFYLSFFCYNILP